MNIHDYILLIDHAPDAKELRDLRKKAIRAGVHCKELETVIDQRFAQLNLTAQPEQKARW
jgi:hypothetical protein